jgi:hypothetical protein
MVTRQKARQRRRKAERPATGVVRVNVAALAPSNSYGVPRFVKRGHYEDEPFTCTGCGAAQVWTAWQQKWWYEVAKGYVYSTAKYCRACRHREQVRSTEARRAHLEGVARKAAASSNKSLERVRGR